MKTIFLSALALVTCSACSVEAKLPVDALLDTIIKAGNSHDCKNMSQHPRKLQNFGNEIVIVTDAAGCFGFTGSAWDSLGFPDFSIVNQRKAATVLLQRSGTLGALNSAASDGQITKQEFQVVISKASRDWGFLPGNPYGETTYTIDSLYAYFQDQLKR